MNRILTIAVSLLVLITFSSVGQTLAQSQEIGVHKGDNFVYSITTQYSSTNPSATIPPNLAEINSTAAFNITVSAVQNPNVNATITWSFSNGTDVNTLFTLDVDSGNVTYYILNLPVFEGFYYTNLNVGDLLRPTGSYLPINQTVTTNYASGLRDTNVVSFTFPVKDASNINLGTQTTTYYIDKATGVLVERIDQAASLDTNSGIYQTGTETWMLKETNIWGVSSPQNPTLSPSIPEFPQTMILTVVAAMFLTITVGLIAYRRRHSHNLAILK